MATVLIAETDPRTIDLLPGILSDRISNVSVEVCTSTDDLTGNRRLSTYDAIAINPILLQGSQLHQNKAYRYSLAPLVLTASLDECELAYTYLENGAFDVIVKPVVSQEAVQTVKVALWQSSLLKLLASRERATERFRQHMEAFPHALQMEVEFASKMAAYEKTLQAITTSLRHILSSDEENSLFDIAGVLESTTRKQALDRLHLMCESLTTH